MSRKFTAAIQSDPEAMKRIVHAYRDLITSTPIQHAAITPYAWTVTRHRCTNACTFFESRNCRDFFICRESGNFHCCTNTTCDRLVQHRDALACELTGLSYSLDLVMDDSATHDHAGHEDREPETVDYGEEDYTANANTETELSIADTMLELAETRHTATATTTPAAAAAASASSASDDPVTRDDTLTLADQSDHYARISLFESVLMSIFRDAQHRIRPLIELVAHNAERLWLLVHQSSIIKQGKQKYQPEYHVLVLLYHMIVEDGWRPSGIQVIPYDAWIKSHLPQVRDLKKVKHGIRNGLNVHNYTQTSKTFSACIRDLIARNASQTLRWVDQLTPSMMTRPTHSPGAASHSPHSRRP